MAETSSGLSEKDSVKVLTAEARIAIQSYMLWFLGGVFTLIATAGFFLFSSIQTTAIGQAREAVNTEQVRLGKLREDLDELTKSIYRKQETVAERIGVTLGRLADVELQATKTSERINQTSESVAETARKVDATNTVKAASDAMEKQVERLINDPVLGEQIKSKLAFANLPIGSIVAWHKNMKNTPTLESTGWLECNGQPVTDPESPYNGETLPNLNGEGRFIRGAFASGLRQDDAFQGHYHRLNTSVGTQAGARVPNIGFSAKADAGEYQTVEEPIDGKSGPVRVAAETRPKNMSMVWIIRVK